MGLPNGMGGNCVMHDTHRVYRAPPEPSVDHPVAMVRERKCV